MFHTFLTKLKGSLRLWPCLLLAIITTTAVGVVYPQQVGLLLWSLTKVFWAFYLAYWLDRWVFHYARPGDVLAARDHGSITVAFCLLMLRRALLMAAVAIAVGLGV